MGRFDKTVEVNWGEAAEEPIFKRWCQLSPNAGEAKWALPGPKYSDWDRLVFDKACSPICYLEIKQRRVELARFGDVILPQRKTDFCVKEGAAHRIPFYLVTLYACGSLVEVDLSQKPDEKFLLARNDRPGQKAVPHVRYEGKKICVLAGPE